VLPASCSCSMLPVQLQPTCWLKLWYCQQALMLPAVNIAWAVWGTAGRISCEGWLSLQCGLLGLFSQSVVPRQCQTVVSDLPCLASAAALCCLLL
jgi:hypothetical protein